MQPLAYIPATQEPRQDHAPFIRRCQSAGITLLSADPEGHPLWTIPRQKGALDPQIVTSNLFLTCLRKSVTRWAGKDDTRAIALWPGCWVVPIPIHKRRQLVGYFVAVLLTHEILESEQMRALCDSMCLDSTLARHRIEEHAPQAVVDPQQWASMLRWMFEDLSTLERQSREIDDLTGQLGEVYEELSLVYKLSTSMSVTHDPMSYLDEAIRELQQVIGLRWAAVLLSDDETRLHAMRGRLLSAGHGPCDEQGLVRIGQELFKLCGQDEDTLIRDAAELGIDGLYPQIGSILVIPISRDDHRLAVLFGGEKIDGTALSSVDTKLATAAAQNMAIFIENGMLYEDMEDIFMGTLHALVASIDAKDSYTFGHSERVAWLSREIAQVSGLDEQTIERVYLSALVHDVGKIGIPESVLTKPGRLTPAEFEMIKAHPELGVKILERIPQMRDLLPGVLHHHERFDGKGYPHKIAGHDIPLFGRIIGLADAFDAMSSSRTYRSSMPVEQVFQELDKCSGTQFDPDLVHAFIQKGDLAQYYAMLAEHQERHSPLRQVMRRIA